MNLLKKEIFNLFTSLGYYLIGTIFLGGSALILFFFSGQFNVFELNQANLYPFFQIAPYFLIILIPSLTMRSFAEEKEKGTYDWLKTMPISSSTVVLSKFLSIFISYFLLLFLSFTFILIIQNFALNGVDYGLLIMSYIGLILFGTFLISIGIFCSIINKNQITAYICAVLIGGFFYFFFDGIADYNLIGNLDFITKTFSSRFHYLRFSQGLFYLSSFIYFVGISLLFLYLTQLKFKK